MNLGLSKEGAQLIKDALIYFFKSTAYPDILLDGYPGVDLQDIFNQLEYILILGPSEEDISKSLSIFQKKENKL